MDEMEKQLEEIEKKLQPLIRKKDKSWVEVYKLLQEVETEELYTVKYSSYTAWISNFAKRYHFTLSGLWKKKKAGKFYMNYFNYYRIQNIMVPPIEHVNIDPASLVMIEKITAGNMVEAQKIINRSCAGTISHDDLKILWESEKKEREKKGIPVLRTNAYDEDEFQNLSYKGYNVQQCTVADIVSTLCNVHWMAVNYQLKGKKYRFLTEFYIKNLDVGMVAIENYSVNNRSKKSVHIHSITIKTTKDELMGLPSFAAYPDYMDLYWLAVPVDLKLEAENHLADHPDIGIILYEAQSHHAFVHKPAHYIQGIDDKRCITIESLVPYLL